MYDPFESRSLNVSGPAIDLMPVVPSDGIDLPSVAIALYVESGGTVSFVSQAGQTRSINLPDHAILPVGVRRVNNTGTSASGVHAFMIG